MKNKINYIISKLRLAGAGDITYSVFNNIIYVYANNIKLDDIYIPFNKVFVSTVKSNYAEGIFFINGLRYFISPNISLHILKMLNKSKTHSLYYNKQKTFLLPKNYAEEITNKTNTSFLDIKNDTANYWLDGAKRMTDKHIELIKPIRFTYKDKNIFINDLTVFNFILPVSLIDKVDYIRIDNIKEKDKYMFYEFVGGDDLPGLIDNIIFNIIENGK